MDLFTGARWLVPEQPAGCDDLRQYLIFRELACDVATIRARKLDIAIHCQRFVIAVARTRPPSKTSAAELAVLHGLVTQVIQYGQVEAVLTAFFFRLAIKEFLRPPAILGKDFITGRDIPVRRQREAISRYAAEMACQSTYSRRGISNLAAKAIRSLLCLAESRDE